jgi:hypothetical protein
VKSSKKALKSEYSVIFITPNGFYLENSEKISTTTPSPNCHKEKKCKKNRNNETVKNSSKDVKIFRKENDLDPSFEDRKKANAYLQALE